MGLPSSAFFRSSPSLFSLFEGLLVCLFAFEHFLLEVLELAKCLGAIQALLGQIIDQLVELAQQLAGLFRRLFLLHLRGELAHGIEVVGGELGGVEAVGGDPWHAGPHLEQSDQYQRREQGAGHAEMVRATQWHGATRVCPLRGARAVCDGQATPRVARGFAGERECVGQAAGETMMRIEAAGTGQWCESPRECHHGHNDDAERQAGEHDARRKLAEKARFACGERQHGQPERHAEARGARVERAIDPHSPLGGEDLAARGRQAVGGFTHSAR